LFAVCRIYRRIWRSCETCTKKCIHSKQS
jgi:hypothetical protein